MKTTTTVAVNLDSDFCDRLRTAAQAIERTPQWVIKQLVVGFIERTEQGAAVGHLVNLSEERTLNEQEILEAIPHGAEHVFLEFAESILPQTVMRAAITAAYRRPESEAVPMLLEMARLDDEQASAANKMALGIAEKLRNQKSAGGRQGLVQGLLQEFSLSSLEGVALMCLAEALLRIPDKATRDALIRDKISHGKWGQHLGQSPSMFVNAASWGLLITGKLVSTHNEAGMSSALNRVIGKSGEPLIRKAVDMAMRLMGEQFVTGETIGKALANSVKMQNQGFRYSYDMLGEAALTDEDARRYLASYEQAIHSIGKASQGQGIYEGPGISIKLSALHPRYSRAQYDRVMDELFPTLLGLTQLAKKYDIGINIDAEEADRLEISLDLLERLCFDPSLTGWNGIGFVIQAYQKRCPYVIDYVIDLAKRSRHRLMIRLVKGAYWDSEIKVAQINGLEGYPVYTRKPYTDLSYIACARKLLAAPQHIYPQFATHNAHSLSAIYQIAGQNYYPGQYEFQCLHGMGEPLYEQVVGKIADGKFNRPCRIYAPVGSHETLLAYLVRRLLENGANTSFVNRIADQTISLNDLVEDPVRQVEKLAAQEGALGNPHPRIPLPRDLYGAARVNSSGLDLSNEQRLASLSSALLTSAHRDYVAKPVIGGHEPEGSTVISVTNPANHRDVVGQVIEASIPDVSRALDVAQSNVSGWQATPAVERALILERAADIMEGELQPLMGLLARESGKTFANAIAEVREAVDFLRYYANQARTFKNDSHNPLGTVVCISPWNFPLAIFTGQIAAALAAGNTVLAKPAEQTPLIAAQGVRILVEAGVPQGVLQLLPGRGETVGAALVGDSRVSGVMFTGSTEVAGILQRTIAGRLDSRGGIVPLIAETGGMNAMIVDSSALVEQVVLDVISSAFDSAGQRCSALRVLCVQEDAADRLIQMLKGAMAEYRLGSPEHLATDIGPVIDSEAKGIIEQHINEMRQRGRNVFQAARFQASDIDKGTFVVPTIIELDSFDELKKEVFGPVLHLVRFKRSNLSGLLDQINASGYGLTLGVHTRIDETVDQVVDSANVGNMYVNRNIVGAVVGVQPFGGEGLSGTGPKAGGPLYMYRLLSSRPQDAVVDRLAGGECVAVERPAEEILAIDALRQWANTNDQAVAQALEGFVSRSPSYRTHCLVGPTGERNTYTLKPREFVLCLAKGKSDLLVELAATLAVGSKAVVPKQQASLIADLPDAVMRRVIEVADWTKADVPIDAILHHGDCEQRANIARLAAARKGPIVGVQGVGIGDTDIPLERLLIEHALSVNTAAAGGNANLMTIG
ncbi:trifunctional transcriptional regulator/proline dehydrogenase/L-glutamate gamma-semialdehyde dehydrogenase [Stutzerimonas chloritidismutans]|uniref:trifunctional transcriptional regulator/proline dehydrogenase/L-glutamate gamma-semialdehyde dehydrogenase n=1 Tax=Stutzerimonas chloritidismutans TaxID=203192 RepID=UPI003F135469